MTRPAPKILIASLGTRGDVQPYAALAAALSRRGANVVLATGAGFADMVAEAGATYRPLPIDYQALLAADDIREALFSLKGKIRAARKNIDLQRDVAVSLFRLCLAERPDLILFNLKAAVVTLAARQLNVPALPTALQPVTEPTGAFPVPLFGWPDWGRLANRASFALLRFLMAKGMATMLKPLRSEAGVRPGDPGALSDGFAPGGGAALSLQAYSAALVPRPDDWPEHALQCGYWFTEPPAAYTPAPDLARFLSAGPPPVYIGFGSMPSRDPAQLAGLTLAALARTDDRAILATGWGGLRPGELPETLRDRVHVLDRAPHAWLFPHCRAVVHHGGAGTTHEALRWGLPSLVLPVFADQPFWGARVHAIGAGPAPIRQTRLSADSLATALDELRLPSYQAGARAAAGLMAAEPGTAGTADRLLAFLSAGSFEAAEP